MKTINCPIYDVTCPYCTEEGYCTLENPSEECEDYAYYDEED